MYFSEGIFIRNSFLNKNSSKTDEQYNIHTPIYWNTQFGSFGLLFFCGRFPIKKKNIYTLHRTIKWKFLPNLVPIGPVVSEKKIKMQKFTDMKKTKYIVMAIPHMILWVNWAKKKTSKFCVFLILYVKQKLIWNKFISNRLSI